VVYSIIVLKPYGVFDEEQTELTLGMGVAALVWYLFRFLMFGGFLTSLFAGIMLVIRFLGNGNDAA